MLKIKCPVYTAYVVGIPLVYAELCQDFKSFAQSTAYQRWSLSKVAAMNPHGSSHSMALQYDFRTPSFVNEKALLRGFPWGSQKDATTPEVGKREPC